MAGRQLLAPAPGWHTEADVVVVGSGVAGVTTVLAIRRALPTARILLATKSVLDDGSTRWAQGGIAAALGPGDTPAHHLTDTLVAGAGLCDVAAVRALVTDGPAAVRHLISLGADFDREPSGPLALTREGGHLRRRIAHAGGDATGAEISRALLAALSAAGDGAGLEVIEHALAIDLLKAADGRAAGITLHVLGEGSRDGVGAVHAGAVVLATGGFGQVYSATTNPRVSTGDGVALALRAGAQVADLEFVQFHPTVLWLGPRSHGRQPLVSEAVRGEGAVLVNAAGRAFMAGQHPLADLAPRDVVAKAIMREMIASGTDHVFLDGRQLGSQLWEHRFPTILASCRSHGIDPVTEAIPVVPAAHYASGGVRTDLHGRTSVAGLYACGEAACTGVHGANRLASNSLLEGLVFAERIAVTLAAGDGMPEAASAVSDNRAPSLLEASIVTPLQALMSAKAGVLRSGDGLAEALAGLAALGREETDKPDAEAWQATNLHLIATALVSAALARQETRGSHWREEFGEPDDAWRGHLVLSLGTVGPEWAFEPVWNE
ncbi:MAG TPA: L-aspartate oxidase [Streptosporangiaceae bacterium]